jgi:hypothetical protein
MMRLLLDENLDWRLHRGLLDHHTHLRLRLIRSLSAFLLAKEDQVNENA